MSPQSVVCGFPDSSVPGGACLGDLPPHLGGLLADRVTSAAGGVVSEARCGARGAACTACGTWSSRVHSGYARTVADVPAGGRPVLIRLRVRRLFCGDLACPVVTFAEQVAGLDSDGDNR